MSTSGPTRSSSVTITLHSLESQETKRLTHYLRHRAEVKQNSMIVDIATSGFKGWVLGHVLGCLMARQVAVGLVMGLFMGHTAELHLNRDMQYNVEGKPSIVVFEQVSLKMQHLETGEFMEIYSLADESHCT